MLRSAERRCDGAQHAALLIESLPLTLPMLRPREQRFYLGQSLGTAQRLSQIGAVNALIVLIDLCLLGSFKRKQQ
jgi:hypothetical protein